ncbi:MAP kinase-activating death domain protein-like isoform X2 [Ruditapes philippinarum]|uniref:MAP kinase-activating death domain protein-like isoform X2 n=1 Tax=Ruditapes philippinarum TaxID=129788 RepID=UPI00295B1E8B|nr:MAP kinase-activating death domain protein-like isoform X2 [Ruditapes philippinarum]
MSEYHKKYFCPRLLDYIVIAGSRHHNNNNNVAQTPELLRRYPLEDHADFPLPTDVIFFCQPEGCISVGPKRMSLRETTSFVFTLTEKDSGKVRYGMCVNFFRPFEKHKERRQHSSSSDRQYSTGSYSEGNRTVSNLQHNDSDSRSPRTSRRAKTASRVRNNTLTSLCIISHHPFFSTFRECLFILRRLIDACHERSCARRVGGSRSMSRDTVWGVLTGQGSDNVSSLVVHEIREIETWILRLLSAPVPVPGKTKVEIQVLPRDVQPPLLFALPDHTRFSLIDFPLHLPLELLGVETCLKVLTAIMLEFKVIMQSRDYNALTMSVMAFVSMLYPLEYMFPVIPLLPTCMSSAEQLLLAPTPYLIGVPASFFLYKKDFQLPEDVWLIDLDSNKINPPILAQYGSNDLPCMPEPEGSILKNHLKQALTSMSMTPQPIKNLDALAQNPEMWKRRESFSSMTGFNPLIYGNDVDSVDVATRVAMVRFFNSANTLGNFSEHTRTLRLYPRPVVAFQLYSFLKSRPVKTHFTHRLAKTQATEYFGEWSLCPQNVAFLRVQTSVFDPLLIGDKAKWYANQLQPITFRVYDEASSLGAALSSATEVVSDDYPTDESGSDSDGAESTSSSYSSLSDFVTDMVNSEIDGDTPSFLPENQVLAVDESKVYNPPDRLQLPDSSLPMSDSAHSQNDSEDDDGGDSSDSSYSSSPRYAPEPDSLAVSNPNIQEMEPSKEFRYDSGNITPTGRHRIISRQDSSGSGSPPPPGRSRPPLQPLNKSINSAFESYEKPPSPRDKVPPSPRERLPSGSSHRVPTSPRPPLSPRDRTPGSPRDLNPPSPRFPRVPPPSPNMGRERFGSQGSQGSQDSGKGGPTVPRSLSMLHPNKNGTKPLDGTENRQSAGSERGASPSSLISTLSSDLTDFAHNASSTFAELFGLSSNKGSKTGTSPVPITNPGPQHQKPTPKPFAPLGNRKALVEKSGLVKHATNRKPTSKEKQKANETKGSSNSENQQFLKEVVSSVQEGQGISWLKMGRVKKLLEDENYRNFMISRLNKNLDKKLNDDDVHIEDVAISKAVYKGMLSLLKAFVHGLETTFQNYGIGGMASAFMVLEIAHTHHWAREHTGSNKSDTSLTPELNSPYGSQESLSIKGENSPRNPDSQSLNEDSMVAALGQQQRPSPLSSLPYGGWNPEHPHGHLHRHNSSPGSPVIVNGDEFENIEIVHNNMSDDNPYKLKGYSGPDLNRNITNSNQKCDIIITGSADDRHRNIHQHSLSSPPADRDVMLEMVKNKGLIKTAKMDERMSSIDSDMSEASTLVSVASDKTGLDDKSRRRSRINHHSIRGFVSDSETETSGGKGSLKKGRSSSLYSNKSSLSTGSRYREGQIISTSPIPGTPEVTKTYLFEGLIGKERSRLWDQMQFWEDVYLDAVAQERDIIGMDQGPAEMMDRYNSLGPGDRKRLEHDEDKLLSVMLYNLVSFMVMTKVHKVEIKKKVRRLLGKSHMGLSYSQEINNLLDKIETLHGNDIDLRPMGSRFMQKQSFTVHWGSDNKGDMLFMEVCDDCIILRSVTGAICDRWWYEKLVNMTYCPKTKVLCLWRKLGDKVQLNQFYTKKCRELYFCVKEAMEKAATRNNSKIPADWGKPKKGPELGGEFPVQDVKSGQGGLLQVCMEGIGLLLANSKSFIELNRIKKCFTLKGEIFILEEFDSKSKQVVQHRFQSSMADQICYAVLCVFSYVAAGNEIKDHHRKQT